MDQITFPTLLPESQAALYAKDWSPAPSSALFEPVHHRHGFGQRLVDCSSTSTAWDSRSDKFLFTANVSSSQTSVPPEQSPFTTTMVIPGDTPRVARHAGAKPLMMVGIMKKKPTKKSPVKKKRNGFVSTTDDSLFQVKPRKHTPHEFVLEALAEVELRTNPMFGCLAVYIGEKIVMILRDKRDKTAADDGVWLATSKDHHESLRCEFPNMRSITVFGTKVTGWQVLPADAPDFETSCLRACELVAAKDPRIGKVPREKRKRSH